MGGYFVSECRGPESTCELGHLKYMKSMVFLFRLSKNRYGYYSSSFQTYKSRSVFQEVKTQGIEIGTFYGKILTRLFFMMPLKLNRNLINIDKTEVFAWTFFEYKIQTSNKNICSQFYRI